MKKYSIRLLFLAVFPLLLAGCLKDKLTRTFRISTPVYKSKSAVFAELKAAGPKEIKNPGKIFLYGNYIFLNEVDKGVHIIDNSNPSAPVNKYFIPVPGNLDMAIKGSIMYVDLYDDLLALDISNPEQVVLKDTLADVFPERSYANGFMRDESQVIVDWIEKDTTVPYTGNNWFPCLTCNFMISMSQEASGGVKAGGVPGIAGSMARFAIVNQVLYALNATKINSINITDPSNLQKVHELEMRAMIETIYPFKDKLFIGSTTGMMICNITDPYSPVTEGTFLHARACDPVIVDDRYAYVTLRTGVVCGGAQNQLDVVDVGSVASPRLVRSYAMDNPHGLAKDGSSLFVCDGASGLKIYNAADPYALKLINEIGGMETYDVIAYRNILYLVAKDGLRQYDYTNPLSLKLLSRIGLKN